MDIQASNHADQLTFHAVVSVAVCHSFQPAIAWLAHKVVDLAPLVSHTVPMADFAPALDQFAKGQTLKVHVQVG